MADAGMTDNSRVHYLSSPDLFREKERFYLEVRRREGRVLADDAVRQLPVVSPSNPYAGEWRWRRRTFTRFLRYCRALVAGRKSFSILDLGCGNGWMANRLAENPEWEVWAVDVNEAELTQGARLFGRKNLRFVFADLLSPEPGSSSIGDSRDEAGLPEMFDLIVLAASVQYFPDLPGLVEGLKKRLNPGGEIHILDSPFYSSAAQQAAAQQRTQAYYDGAGVPGMAAFYHHHLWEDAEKTGGVNLNKSLFIKFLQKVKWLAPFPWVVIGKG